MRIAQRMTLAAMVAAAAVLGVADARTWRLEPGPEAQAQLQNALSRAEPGDTVRLDRGRYELTAGLTLSANDVEVRGDGQDRTVLSFAGQQGNAAGLSVSGSEAVLRDFAVEDAHGDGVVARDCNSVTMRGLRAEWTRAPGMAPTAYGLHVVNCGNVLIEDSIARGATAGGIGVSGSRTVMVRRNVAERNGAGVTIENSMGADVFENTSQNNAAGVAVINAPGAQGDARGVRIFANTLNNNAGQNGGGLPPGAGVVIVAGRDVHVFENEIGGNATANVMVMAFPGSAGDAAAYSPLPRDVMIRDNRFGVSGTAPAGDYATVAQGNAGALADVIWDGADTYYAASGPRTELPRIVMRDNRSARGGIGSFLSLGLNVAGAPLSEAAPNPAYPPLLDLREPERVRIDD